MAIYILIICCLYTLLGITGCVLLLSDKDSFNDEPGAWLIGLFVFITGVIAIVFQSINL